MIKDKIKSESVFLEVIVLFVGCIFSITTFIIYLIFGLLYMLLVFTDKIINYFIDN